MSQEDIDASHVVAFSNLSAAFRDQNGSKAGTEWVILMNREGLEPAYNQAESDASRPETCFGYPTLFVFLEFTYSYYLPVIIFMGLVGNFLSCIVFLNTHLKMRSSSYYLAALAVADFGFLFSILLVWSNEYLGVELFHREGWCQALVYLSSVCGFLSVWLIVAFTVERFIAVQYPLHRPTMCTVARAKTIVTCITLFALGVNCYTFFTAGIVEATKGVRECGMFEDYRETMHIINIIDSLVTLIIPLVCIVVMNVMITRNLIKFRRTFNNESGLSQSSCTITHRSDFNLNQLNSSSSSQPSASAGSNRNVLLKNEAIRMGSFHSSSNVGRPGPGPMSGVVSQNCQLSATAAVAAATGSTAPPPGRIKALGPARCIHVRSSNTNLVSTRTQQSITKMLLLISTVFVLLNLPSYGVRLFVFVWYSLWRQNTPETLWCIQQLFMVLYYTNFSVNFLLYSMCGITFRRCLWQMIRNLCKKLSRLHYSE
ncbi:uncharacterized protein CNMaR isoform X2 [Bemisia tabaci]|uniref:uncharacterized protein CNMaR isoform X2 n=1 Tax=Bemisia tabaci TaxID=7038 RepID=UPI0008F9CA64|nr:PREDICTED: D(2) dopamine receptor isoform X2 [Bemisia tabaci]